MNTDCTEGVTSLSLAICRTLAGTGVFYLLFLLSLNGLRFSPNFRDYCIIGLPEYAKFVFASHKIIGNNALLISLNVGLSRTWNPAPTVCSIISYLLFICNCSGEAINIIWFDLIWYFPAPCHLANLRKELPFPSHCSVGGVLLVRSDYKTWAETERSLVFTCCHIDLCLHCSFHLIFVISNNLTSSSSTGKGSLTAWSALPTFPWAFLATAHAVQPPSLTTLIYYWRQKKCHATKKVSSRENCYNFFSIKDRDKF